MWFQLAPVWSTTFPFIPTVNRPQVAESLCSCGGSNKAVSVERNSIRKEQSLEPLSLFSRRSSLS